MTEFEKGKASSQLSEDDVIVTRNVEFSFGKDHRDHPSVTIIETGNQSVFGIVETDNQGFNTYPLESDDVLRLGYYSYGDFYRSNSQIIVLNDKMEVISVKAINPRSRTMYTSDGKRQLQESYSIEKTVFNRELDYVNVVVDLLKDNPSDIEIASAAYHHVLDDLELELMDLGHEQNAANKIVNQIRLGNIPRGGGFEDFISILTQRVNYIHSLGYATGLRQRSLSGAQDYFDYKNGIDQQIAQGKSLSDRPFSAYEIKENRQINEFGIALRVVGSIFRGVNTSIYAVLPSEAQRTKYYQSVISKSYKINRGDVSKDIRRYETSRSIERQFRQFKYSALLRIVGNVIRQRTGWNNEQTPKNVFDGFRGYLEERLAPKSKSKGTNALDELLAEEEKDSRTHILGNDGELIDDDNSYGSGSVNRRQ